MKCFYCETEVRWNNDYDTEDTYPESFIKKRKQNEYKKNE